MSSAGRAQMAAEVGTGGRTVTFALLGGSISWIARLIIGSWLVSAACRSGVVGMVALYGVSGVFLVFTVLALRISIRLFRPCRDPDWDEGELPGAAYVGILGILLNVTALVAIITESVSIAFLDPCQPRL
jgi:hypothetical protein